MARASGATEALPPTSQDQPSLWGVTPRTTSNATTAKPMATLPENAHSQPGAGACVVHYVRLVVVHARGSVQQAVEGRDGVS